MSGEWPWSERLTSQSDYIHREEPVNICPAVRERCNDESPSAEWVHSSPGVPCFWAQLGGICWPFCVYQQDTTHCRENWHLQSPPAASEYFFTYTLIPGSALCNGNSFNNLAAKVVVVDRFQHGGLRLWVELSASWARTVNCVCNNDTDCSVTDIPFTKKLELTSHPENECAYCCFRFKSFLGRFLLKIIQIVKFAFMQI